MLLPGMWRGLHHPTETLPSSHHLHIPIPVNKLRNISPQRRREARRRTEQEWNADSADRSDRRGSGNRELVFPMSVHRRNLRFNVFVFLAIGGTPLRQG